MEKTRDLNKLVMVVDDFLNEKGLWEKFKNYVKERGYTLEGLGMMDDE